MTKKMTVSKTKIKDRDKERQLYNYYKQKFLDSRFRSSRYVNEALRGYLERNYDIYLAYESSEKFEWVKAKPKTTLYNEKAFLSVPYDRNGAYEFNAEDHLDILSYLVSDFFEEFITENNLLTMERFHLVDNGYDAIIDKNELDKFMYNRIGKYFAENKYLQKLKDEYVDIVEKNT